MYHYLEILPETLIFNDFSYSSASISEIIAKFAYMKLIELNLQRILDLCRKHKVKTLSVFGSILTDRFNDQSDVDLLVDFEPIDHDTFDYVGNYFDLKDSLEQLFNRKVDLIEYGKNLNPIFKALVDKKKQLIYG
ncbi:nucleotidyltransferase family protein [Paramuribaculum intestinale]|nr:nucleotidyltransferase domain-containing protein [Paramuribaculum intestinale]